MGGHGPVAPPLDPPLLLVQLIPHINCSIREKNTYSNPRVHRNLTSFQVCPLVPLMLLSKVKSSFSLSLNNPLHILKTSIRSCLFLLSSSVHSFNQQSNLSSYVFASMLLIVFVNLFGTFSIISLSFI